MSTISFWAAGLRSGWNKENHLRSALAEFKILNRLRHRHVVSVLEIYQYKSRLAIIMQQVADTDLSDYFDRVDNLEHNDIEFNSLKRRMQAWPGCLIQAMDYLHEMKIKHKDLKPGNLLVMRDQILIADFGISKDLIDEETTASFNTSGNIGTKLYSAPEVLSENHRRDDHRTYIH